MTPAANAGGNQDLTSTRKGAQNSGSGKPAKKHNSHNRKSNKNSGTNKNPSRQKYAKRVDEVSAGGLVVDKSGTKGLLIGRLDPKDASHERLLWSLPKGHIEDGESPDQAAIRNRPPLERWLRKLG